MTLEEVFELVYLGLCSFFFEHFFVPDPNISKPLRPVGSVAHRGTNPCFSQELQARCTGRQNQGLWRCRRCRRCRGVNVVNVGAWGATGHHRTHQTKARPKPARISINQHCLHWFAILSSAYRVNIEITVWYFLQHFPWYFHFFSRFFPRSDAASKNSDMLSSEQLVTACGLWPVVASGTIFQRDLRRSSEITVSEWLWDQRVNESRSQRVNTPKCIGVLIMLIMLICLCEWNRNGTGICCP